MKATATYKESHKDSWIQSFSGKAFNIFVPRITDVDIIDIAHALSHICRYGGHCRIFYCVAQHCVEGSRLLDDGTDEGRELAKQFLLHDSAEAYIGDMTRPMKRTPEMKMFRDVEENIERLIAKRFGLSYPYDPRVKQMDNALLGAEYQAVMRGKLVRKKAKEGTLRDWQFPEPPADVKIKPMTSYAAKRAYLRQFRKLFEEVA